jgi:hypothetical protein
LTPRIALNGLAKYLTVTASQRRTIIREQKRPSDFQVTYYREAEEAVAQQLVAEAPNPSIARAVFQEATQSATAKEWELTRRGTGAEAVEAFLELAPAVDFLEAARRRGSKNPRRLEIGRVSISVRPEVVLERESKDGLLVGAVKLYFSKTNPLTEERAKYTGTILYRYAQERLSQDKKVDYRLCHVIDVFARKIYRAPRTYKQRLKDVEAACEEIARVWPFVE